MYNHDTFYSTRSLHVAFRNLLSIKEDRDINISLNTVKSEGKIWNRYITNKGSDLNNDPLLQTMFKRAESAELEEDSGEVRVTGSGIPAHSDIKYCWVTKERIQVGVHLQA